MKRNLALFLKELHSNRFSFYILVAAVLLWHIFLLTRQHWEDEILMITGILPLQVLPFWVLWISFNSLRQEWREKTIYFLGTLPLTGLAILGTKTLAIIAMGVFGLFAFGLSILSFLFVADLTHMIPPLPTRLFFGNGVLGFSLYLLVLFITATVAQWSYLLGKAVGKLSGFVAGVAFFLSVYLLVWASTFLQPYFSWLPKLRVESAYESYSEIHFYSHYIDISGFLIAFILGLGILWVAGRLFEKNVDL